VERNALKKRQKARKGRTFFAEREFERLECAGVKTNGSSVSKLQLTTLGTLNQRRKKPIPGRKRRPGLKKKKAWEDVLRVFAQAERTFLSPAKKESLNVRKKVHKTTRLGPGHRGNQTALHAYALNCLSSAS